MVTKDDMPFIQRPLLETCSKQVMGESYVFGWKFGIWLSIQSHSFAIILHPGSWGTCLLNPGAPKKDGILERANAEEAFPTRRG